MVTARASLDKTPVSPSLTATFLPTHQSTEIVEIATNTPSPKATATTSPPGRNDLINRVIDLSADGRLLLFQSNAPSLPGAAFPTVQTYLYDRVITAFERVGVDRANFIPTDLSPEGRYIIYSAKKETTADAGDQTAVYLLDRQTGQSEVISVGDQGQTEAGGSGRISGDGRFVVFVSQLPGLRLTPSRETLLVTSFYATGTCRKQSCLAWGPTTRLRTK